MVAADGGRFDALARRHAGPAGSRLVRRRSPHQLGLRLRRRAERAFQSRRSAPAAVLEKTFVASGGLPEADDTRMPRAAGDCRARDGIRVRPGQRRRGSRPAAGHRGLRRDLRDQVLRQATASLLGPQRREDRRTSANRVARITRSCSRTLRSLRQGTDGRHDEGRRREVCEDHRAGLSRVRRRERPGRGREQAAAVLHEGKHQQRRHRHGGRVLPDGPDLGLSQPVAGQGIAGPRADVLRLAALEVSQRAARSGHVSVRLRPRRRRRGHARRGKRQHADSLRCHRARGRQRRFCRALVAAAHAVGEVPGKVRPGSRGAALHGRFHGPSRPQREPVREGDPGPGGVWRSVPDARRQGDRGQVLRPRQGRRQALDESRRRGGPLPPGLRQAGNLEPEIQSRLGPHPGAERLPALRRREGGRALQESDAPLRRSAWILARI